VRFVDFTNYAELENIVKEMKPALLWFETPTNPLMKVIDIERVVEIGKKHSPESLIVVDNTFATPIFQRPAKYGLMLSFTVEQSI